MMKEQLFQKNNMPIIFGVLVSLVLSFWMSWQAGVVNPDAICYLQSAAEFGQAGLTSAIKLCPQAQWPFYSILIYIVASLLHVTFSTAAYLLDAIFTLISVTFFMLIVRSLGGTQRTLWFAALVILSAHHFIGVREYIIRDHGFWAFYLASIYYLQAFVTRPRPQAILLFTLSAMIASLFRIEGLIFLACTPFIVWLLHGYSLRQRAKMFLMLYLPLILISCLLAIIWVLHSYSDISHTSRLNNFYRQISQAGATITYRFQASKQGLMQYVLPLESQANAGTIWVLTLISWYFVELISNLTPIYALLLIYAWLYRLPSSETYIQKNRAIVLITFVAINILITAGFFAEYLFLSKRYLLALSLTLMLWVPFALDHLFSLSTQRRYRFLTAFVSMIILVYAITALFHQRDSKLYLNQAGTWLAKHVPAHKTIYSNDLLLMYYSNHFGNTIFNYKLGERNWPSFSKGEWKQFDYLALRIDHHDESQAQSFIKQIPSQPVQTYHNQRGDKVLIYQMHS